MKNDDAKLEELFRTCYRKVFTFFRNRGFSNEDSQDLTQDAFLRVYTHMETFREEAKLETFLFLITRTIWKNAVRRLLTQKRKAEEIPIEPSQDADSLPLAAATNTDEKALAQELRRHLSQAIEELPPRMRQCVRMFYIQELKVREIAQVLKISRQTVKSHLHTARRQLSESLGEVYGPIDFGEEERN